MMIWSLHIVSITLLVAVVGGIAFHMGKKEGIRITEIYFKEQQNSLESKEKTSPPSSTIS